MPKLTHKYLLAITFQQAGQLVRDEGGLFGRVRLKVDGTVSIPFYYRYRYGGKLHDISCGTWPVDSLAQIRAKRDEARGATAAGIDPATRKKVNRIEMQEAMLSKIAQTNAQREAQLTVADLFDLWIVNGVKRKDGNADLKRRFTADVLPSIGGVAISELSEHDLREVLRTLVMRDANRSAVMMLHSLKQMLGWAQKRQPWRRLLSEGNPVDLIDIRTIVSAAYDMNKVRERVLSAAEIRELQDIFKRMRVEYATAPDRRVAAQPLEIATECAIWIMLGTMCRVGELSMARWEHVDFDLAEWFIPRENVKDRVGNQTVHLSAFVMTQFRRLHECTSESVWCFPSRDDTKHINARVITKQISDRQTSLKHGRDGGPRAVMTHRCQDDRLVLQSGKNGAWTAHDLRRTGATLMQSLGVTLDVIDRCQNHVLAGSKVRRHYLHYDYSREKMEAWTLLGKRFQEILDHQKSEEPDAV
ncbi:tyrosine-type recombinase/integrase [Duganella aceris]|uniref:Tyrosine-type recombinase/integrase n=1 Tax=Duganella aceris TaxID=2703883 RepID=A0ABX0FV92_9BURK|nr:tyrosine-type recombinase/integrase [Duganella aceris]NGZ88600.1 tyrosine-type recombinase/integrase [Duganella aceris]